MRVIMLILYSYLVPGPPATFGFNDVYGNEVHLYWETPCEPNGRLGDYKLTVSADAKGKIQEQRLDNNVTVYKVLGLVKLTKYKFELVATTSKGEGTAKILVTTTPGNPGTFFLRILITVLYQPLFKQTTML